MDKLDKVRAVIKAGDLDKAHKMLRWLLKHEPSADAWVVAAHLADDTDEKIKCLRQALALDVWHNEANRLLYKLEGSTPKQIIKRETEWDRKVGEKPVTAIERQRKQDRFQQHAARQRRYTRLGCVFSLIFSMCFSVAVFRAAGLLSTGLTVRIASLLQQPTPIQNLNSTPIALVDKPHLRLTPSRVELATAQDVEILDAGYLHEHNFNATAGTEYAVYVQFLSVTAKRVSRNVIIVDPNNGEAGQRCQSQRILSDDTNVAYICLIDVTGKWRVLILGRDQESVGTYFVGAQKLD